MRLRNIPGADEAVAESACCVNEPQGFRGNWRQLLRSVNPIYLEIGMGKGRFIIDSAAAHPQASYIGIERYSSVLLRALQKMGQPPLANLRFICMDASEIGEVFAPGEISRIYLNFPDPWPKDRHAKRRLTSRQFLARYAGILAEGGCIELKTDNQALFSFSLEELGASGWRVESLTYDLHHSPAMLDGNIMTEYEEKFSAAGQAICKLVAARP